MERLLEFLNRLERHRAEYGLEKCPLGDAIRVHTWAASERWVIDFWPDGNVDVDCFRSDPSEIVEGEGVLENLFGRMEKAWLLAAQDLDIEFKSPFFLTTEDGRQIRCAGLLPHFGGPKGAVIVSREDPDEAEALADARGYYVSGLSPRYYEDYDRERFVETLSDWGWYGPADIARPDWLRSA